MPLENKAALALAETIAARFAVMREVEAVALAGSRTSPFADDQSDVDLYVYGRAIVPTSLRTEIARNARRTEIGNSFWEPGDEWIDAESGIRIDAMFRTIDWTEEQLDRVLQRHEASVGYSTCFWYNVRNSRAMFDRSGWFKALQERAKQPYPEELKRAIVTKNHPILRNNISSYLHQIELALQRQDPISVNHRAAAMLASYFDIVFAVNGQPHPGEKRLVEFAGASCPNLPTGMVERVTALLSALPDNRVTERANAMLDGLDDLLRHTRFL
ncbi:MAG: DUF4037 domain-containing protein [Acidobacteriia bacterium]|nr:DUF4037 domain-containing protein [Terriglobia bacterium]